MSPSAQKLATAHEKATVESCRWWGEVFLYLPRASGRACGRVGGGNGDDLTTPNKRHLGYVGAQQTPVPGSHGN